jgi:alpha-galactosidase
MRFSIPYRALSAAIPLIALTAGVAHAQTLAATPPMGWNSWDAYGLTINEKDFRANAQVLASLKSSGWIYAVIDEGWYLKDPFAKPDPHGYWWDSRGRLIPDPARYPSARNGAGFRPVADWLHAQGLKFGIHIIRGIPKGVVRQNLPIANSGFRASDAADTNDTCPWNPDNYGVRDTPAGQAYYDSIISLYAGWGVDFLKVDCIADHPYKSGEIRMISTAIAKSGRPIVLSLSPGPASLAHAEELSKYAQMWRIADDIWDGWAFPAKQDWPNGLLSAFDNLAKWSKYAKPGNWPDADMLPWGSLRPHPGWGPPRQSRLTQDEQRTQFTLWAMARSPLILGGNLTELDEFTRSLITNKEVIAINQTAVRSGEVAGEEQDSASARWWFAERSAPEQGHYVAIFNLQQSSLPLNFQEQAWDVWAGKPISGSPVVPPHACVLLRIAK